MLYITSHENQYLPWKQSQEAKTWEACCQRFPVNRIPSERCTPQPLSIVFVWKRKQRGDVRSKERNPYHSLQLISVTFFTNLTLSDDPGLLSHQFSVVTSILSCKSFKHFCLRTSHERLTSCLSLKAWTKERADREIDSESRIWLFGI